MSDKNAALIKSIGNYTTWCGIVGYWKARVDISSKLRPESREEHRVFAQECMDEKQAAADKYKAEITQATSDPVLWTMIDKCAEEHHTGGIWDGGLDMGDEELHKKKRREHYERGHAIMAEIEAYLIK